VQSNQRSQPFFWALDPARNTNHSFFGDVHGVRHDVEKDFVFRLEVVVEASFGELERGGDIVHRRSVIALLLKKTSGSTKNFLARFNRGFAMHPERWYRRCDQGSSQFAQKLDFPSIALHSLP
jgi:hypothetical protein